MRLTNKVELENKNKELDTAKAAARLSERKAEAAAQESTCSVRLSSKKNAVFLPCFHLATCSDCAPAAATDAPVVALSARAACARTSHRRSRVDLQS